MWLIVSNQRYFVLFKLFLYANKVSFNAESRINVVLSMASLNIRGLGFPFQASND